MKRPVIARKLTAVRLDSFLQKEMMSFPYKPKVVDITIKLRTHIVYVELKTHDQEQLQTLFLINFIN